MADLPRRAGSSPGSSAAYQRFISPAAAARAAGSTPSCSQYALEAITRHGALRGTWLAARRLARCHPFIRAASTPFPEPRDLKSMDRRAVWAILLMMVIAIAPAILHQAPRPPSAPAAGQASRPDAPAASAAPAGAGRRAGAEPAGRHVGPSRTPTPNRRHRPGHLAAVHLRDQHARAADSSRPGCCGTAPWRPETPRAVAEMLRRESRCLVARWSAGRTPSRSGLEVHADRADSLGVTGPTPLRLHAARGRRRRRSDLHFRPRRLPDRRRRVEVTGSRARTAAAPDRLGPDARQHRGRLAARTTARSRSSPSERDASAPTSLASSRASRARSAARSSGWRSSRSTS